MKKLLLFSICAAIACAAIGCTEKGADSPIKVISYNIRMSGSPAADGDNYWSNRKQASINMVNDEQPDVMGIQEGCPDQIAFLDEHLPHYKHIGVGREDGKAEGEIMAIYYRTDRVELLDGGTFWLSETPDEVSKGWDGACKRTCTWALMRMKDSGKEFAYFNTHLDHVGPTARAEALKLIVKRMGESVPEGMPLFLTADFNSTTDEPIFEPLKAVMRDARAEAPQSDPRGTFNDWGRANDVVIDHIFFRNADAQSFAVLCDKNYGAPYISDHYPVVLTAEI